MLRFTLGKDIKASNIRIEDSLKKFFINFAGELTKDIEPSEQISVPRVENCKASDIVTSHPLMMII